MLFLFPAAICPTFTADGYGLPIKFQPPLAPAVLAILKFLLPALMLPDHEMVADCGVGGLDSTAAGNCVRAPRCRARIPAPTAMVLDVLVKAFQPELLVPLNAASEKVKADGLFNMEASNPLLAPSEPVMINPVEAIILLSATGLLNGCEKKRNALLPPDTNR